MPANYVVYVDGWQQGGGDGDGDLFLLGTATQRIAHAIGTRTWTGDTLNVRHVGPFHILDQTMNRSI